MMLRPASIRAAISVLGIGIVGLWTLAGATPVTPGGLQQIIFALQPIAGGGSPIDTQILAIPESPPFSPAPVGLAGVAGLSGADFDPQTGALFVSGGNNAGGNLYTVDRNTGAATLIGWTGFQAVPGLAFSSDGTLFGSALIGGGANAALITIDPITGAGVTVGPFAFGPAIDPIYIDGLAVDPYTGVLYGVGGRCLNAACDLSTSELYTIDTSTGAATSLGNLEDGGGPLSSTTFTAGMSFAADGTLYVSLGARDGRILQVDFSGRGNPTFVVYGDVGSGSVSDIAIDNTRGLSGP